MSNQKRIFDIIEDEVKKFRNLEEFGTKNRKRELVRLRQEAMYFTKKFTKYSLAAIGALIGNKNHATVLYSYNVIKNQIQVDRCYAKEMYDLNMNILNKIDEIKAEETRNTLLKNRNKAVSFIYETMNNFSDIKVEIYMKTKKFSYILHCQNDKIKLTGITNQDKTENNKKVFKSQIKRTNKRYGFNQKIN